MKKLIAIGVIYTCRRAARCGILFFVQKNVCRFQCLPLRCDPHEARIDGVANKKPLFNCVYILPIFPKTLPMLFAGGRTHLQTYKYINLQTYKLTHKYLVNIQG